MENDKEEQWETTKVKISILFNGELKRGGKGGGKEWDEEKEEKEEWSGKSSSSAFFFVFLLLFLPFLSLSRQLRH